MDMYEQLQDEARKDGIDVLDYCFESERIKGLYCDGTVAIRKDLNITEKSCVLAEELGHHYTTSGNILDQSTAVNRKQEQRARLWAYNRQIGLMGIISAWKHGCRTCYEMAEFLGVTEEFLSEALSAYKSKYGIYKAIVLYFQNLRLKNYGTTLIEWNISILCRSMKKYCLW